MTSADPIAALQLELAQARTSAARWRIATLVVIALVVLGGLGSLLWQSRANAAHAEDQQRAAMCGQLYPDIESNAFWECVVGN